MFVLCCCCVSVVFCVVLCCVCRVRRQRVRARVSRVVLCCGVFLVCASASRSQDSGDVPATTVQYPMCFIEYKLTAGLKASDFPKPTSFR